MSRRELGLWSALAIATTVNVVMGARAVCSGGNGSVSVASDVEAGLVVDRDPFDFETMPTLPQWEVPMARFLANPRAFEGKRIALMGYVGYRVSAHGRLFLYASSNDAALHMTTNAVPLAVSGVDPSRLDGPCSVVGVFHADYADPIKYADGVIVVESMDFFHLVRGADGGTWIESFEPGNVMSEGGAE